MPPLPKKANATDGPDTRSSSPRRRTTRTKDPGAESGGPVETEAQKARPDAETGPRPLTPKFEQLREKLVTMYKVIGTLLIPLGGIIPPLGAVGQGLRTASVEAADAWIELAREDRKVLLMLEDMTKASTWGNVIGIHASILMSAIPGMAALTAFEFSPPASTPGGGGVDSMIPDLSGMNLSQSDLEILSQMVQSGGGQMAAMPVVDVGVGGPGDTVRVSDPPQFQAASVAAPTAAPPVAQSTAVPKAAIVSPEQLGVRVMGQQGGHPFPASGAPNGAVSAIT
jgi:hypothetical protein